jgi:hypothetical protein
MRQREKQFGLGRPQPIDRESKVRIMHLARCLAHHRAAGRHRGIITRAALEVLQSLLWRFHGPQGFAFPSYETIAEAAGCARSTVAAAIHQLEEACILTWVHRLKRVRYHDQNALAWRTIPVRTSNVYRFTTVGGSTAPPPKSDKTTGTESRGLPLELSCALNRLQEARRGGLAQDPDRCAVSSGQ